MTRAVDFERLIGEKSKGYGGDDGDEDVDDDDRRGERDVVSGAGDTASRGGGAVTN